MKQQSPTFVNWLGNREAGFRRDVNSVLPVDQRPISDNLDWTSLKLTLEENERRIHRYEASIDDYRRKLDAIEVSRSSMAKDLSAMRQAADQAGARYVAAEHRCRRLSTHAKDLEKRLTDANDRCRLASDAQAEATRRYEETACLLYETLSASARQPLAVLPSTFPSTSDVTKVRTRGSSFVAAGRTLIVRCWGERCLSDLLPVGLAVSCRHAETMLHSVSHSRFRLSGRRGRRMAILQAAIVIMVVMTINPDVAHLAVRRVVHPVETTCTFQGMMTHQEWSDFNVIERTLTLGSMTALSHLRLFWLNLTMLLSLIGIPRMRKRPC